MEMKILRYRVKSFYGSELLEKAGKVSHLEATTKAMLEFEKYKQQIKNDFTGIELDFLCLI